jgi:hypothetical protein
LLINSFLQKSPDRIGNVSKVGSWLELIPKYCPNCGKAFNDESLVKSFTSLIFNHKKKGEISVPVNGWGVECFYCKWNGEILPDDEEL